MKFSSVAEIFDAIEQESARLAITKLLADLLARATAKEAGIICTMSLGQLHPPHIGTQFNLAEKNVIKTMTQLLGESEAVVTQRVKARGDLGVVIVEGDWRATDELTVNQV